MLMINQEFDSPSQRTHLVKIFETHPSSTDIRGITLEHRQNSTCETNSTHCSFKECSSNVLRDDDLPKFDTQRLVMVIASVLEEMMDLNECEGPRPTTVFHCRSVPKIAIGDYLLRITRFSDCSFGCYILALIYLDELHELHPNFVIDSMNVHRYFIFSSLKIH
eukprot:TRINITY_DN3041_c0_g1_i5.p1 TRINITY_DN3041_c0_g1~~TRINITY_DN3041_c0_g1_i5.p1  ORF type:complete len:164 (+),score=13.43 TRINITY_DN3041_c0_g1_i5:130-621(+)